MFASPAPSSVGFRFPILLAKDFQPFDGMIDTPHGQGVGSSPRHFGDASRQTTASTVAVEEGVHAAVMSHHPSAISPSQRKGGVSRSSSWSSYPGDSFSCSSYPAEAPVKARSSSGSGSGGGGGIVLEKPVKKAVKEGPVPVSRMIAERAQLVSLLYAGVPEGSSKPAPYTTPSTPAARGTEDEEGGSPRRRSTGASNPSTPITSTSHPSSEQIRRLVDQLAVLIARDTAVFQKHGGIEMNRSPSSFSSSPTPSEFPLSSPTGSAGTGGRSSLSSPFQSEPSSSSAAIKSENQPHLSQIVARLQNMWMRAYELENQLAIEAAEGEGEEEERPQEPHAAPSPETASTGQRGVAADGVPSQTSSDWPRVLGYLHSAFETLVRDWPVEVSGMGYIEWWLSFPFLCGWPQRAEIPENLEVEAGSPSMARQQAVHTHALLKTLVHHVDRWISMEEAHGKQCAHSTMWRRWGYDGAADPGALEAGEKAHGRGRGAAPSRDTFAGPRARSCRCSGASTFSSEPHWYSAQSVISVLQAAQAVTFHIHSMDSLRFLCETVMHVCMVLPLYYLLPYPLSTTSSGSSAPAIAGGGRVGEVGFLWENSVPTFPEEPKRTSESLHHGGCHPFECVRCRQGYRNLFMYAVRVMARVLQLHAAESKRLSELSHARSFLTRMLWLRDAYHPSGMGSGGAETTTERPSSLSTVSKEEEEEKEKERRRSASNSGVALLNATALAPPLSMLDPMAEVVEAFSRVIGW